MPRQRKKFIPPGTETEGIRRRLEGVARELKLPHSRVRMARYTFHENGSWTIREVIEIFVENAWVERPKAESTM